MTTSPPRSRGHEKDGAKSRDKGREKLSARPPHTDRLDSDEAPTSAPREATVRHARTDGPSTPSEAMPPEAMPSDHTEHTEAAVRPPSPLVTDSSLPEDAHHHPPNDTHASDDQRDHLRLPTIQDIWRAYDVVRPHISHTPLLPSRTLSAMSGAHIYLKAENLQRSGAYKIRGATYKLARLSPEERAQGVIAASAGNHAQGVAIAASSLGIPCTIVMPTSAPLAKVTATQNYGASVVLAGESYNEAHAVARDIQAQTGATFIPAFDDPDVIAGQGTLGLEILSDLPDVEAIVVGIGGGGLISGIATAIKSLKPAVAIYGVQAAGAASMRAALDAGQIVTLPGITTIADGIATKATGEYTYEIVRRLVDEVVTVEDEEIIAAVLLLLERCKLLVEGAGAAGLAAALSGRLPLAGKRTAVVLSGGNIDMNLVGRFIQHGLSVQGRYLVIHTLLTDRPGELLRLLSLLAAQGVNVLDVEHHRAGPRLPIQQVEVALTLETRNRAHCEEVLASLRAAGFPVEEMQPAFTLGATTEPRQ